MKQTCFLLVFTLLLLWISTQANAQTAQNAETTVASNESQPPGGEIPTECGGSPSGESGSCNFQCRAGDTLYIWGSAVFDGRGAMVRVRASCGAVMLECFARRPFQASCEVTSVDLPFDDKRGSCQVEGLRVEDFGCGSYAPESEAGESSDENA